MARIPKQRVIFDAEKYDLDYLRETRDSYSPMTDAEFEDSISYDMGEDDLLDLMEMDWRSNEKALDAFLGKSILVRYSPVNYDDGFVQFNLNDLDDLLHTHTSPLHRVDKVWDEDGHLFFSGKWPDNSPLLVEVRKLTDDGEQAMDGILAASRSGDSSRCAGLSTPYGTTPRSYPLRAMRSLRWVCPRRRPLPRCHSTSSRSMMRLSTTAIS